MAVSIARPDWVRAQLERHLPRYLGGDEVRVGELESPAGGQSNETVLFSAKWSRDGAQRSAELVLRLQPDQNRLFLDADVLAEGRLVDALFRDSAVPVPEVIAIEDDPSVLGRPFFLMDRVTGNVPGGRPSIHRDPWLMSLTAAQRRMAMTNGLDALAAVHATPWHALPGMTEKSRTRAEELAELQRWYDWARRDQHFQLIEAAIAALGGAQPDISEDVLLWGDPRPGNIIFAGDLSVAAVIDWEIAGLGPREADVGWWLMMDEFASRGVDGAVLDGMPTAAESVAYYCAASGSALGALEYFALLASVRLAITLLPAADSLITRGIIPATSRFAHDNVPTQMIARHLGKSEPELSDDYRRLSRMGRATGSGVSSGTGG